MNDSLMEILLNEAESSTLDFKRDQYPFSGASDEQKGEILKDILAFANTPRRIDAYILIGVEEVRGGRSIVHGVSNHILEHTLQEFVNKKLNRSVEFSYQVYPFEGKSIGVITIPIQDGPYYSTKNYGRIAMNTVFIRRGSSTDIATPDEIARMGANTAARRQVPTLDLQFANRQTGEGLGQEITMESVVLNMPDHSEIPDLGSKTSRFFLSEPMANSDYYREYADFFSERAFFHPVRFLLRNTGPVLLTNARLFISVANESELSFCTEEDLPDSPRKFHSISPLSEYSFGDTRTTYINIESHDDHCEISILFGNIQPGAASRSHDLYIGSAKTQHMVIEGLVFADNLPQPVQVHLTFNINTQEHDISFEKLYEIVEKPSTSPETDEEDG